MIHAIYPYPTAGGLWAFDDAATGLQGELLVFGTDAILDDLIAEHLGMKSRQPFALNFSDAPFPGHQLFLKWRNEGDGGNWYARQPDGRLGWLCPALFKYFPTAPRELYATAMRKNFAQDPRDAAPAPRLAQRLNFAEVEARVLASMSPEAADALRRGDMAAYRKATS